MVCLLSSAVSLLSLPTQSALSSKMLSYLHDCSYSLMLRVLVHGQPLQLERQRCVSGACAALPVAIWSCSRDSGSRSPCPKCHQVGSLADALGQAPVMEPHKS